jgi:hypothetical protein
MNDHPLFPSAGRHSLTMLAVLGLAATTATALEAPLLDDTFVDNGTTTSPTQNVTNYGKSAVMRVYQSGTRVMKTLIRFDVGTNVMPPGVTSSQITQATLQLWINDAGGTVGDFKIARLTADWVETTIKNSTSPFPTYADETVIPMTGYAEGEYRSDIDITDWVKNWNGGAYPNYGIILFPIAGSTVNMQFDTKESLDTAHQARLEVEYTAPARTWLTGTSTPTAGQGSQGDIYLNTATGQYYVKGASAWGTPVSIVGPQGIQGIQGIQGVAGKTWYYGTGVPGAQGVDGDLYLNTAANQYYIKAVGSWGSPVNIGRNWYTGTSAPLVSLGFDGDFYMNTASSQYYFKSASVWNGPVSLVGSTGAQGPAGPVRIQPLGDLSMGEFVNGTTP